MHFDMYGGGAWTTTFSKLEFPHLSGRRRGKGLPPGALHRCGVDLLHRPRRRAHHQHPQPEHNHVHASIVSADIKAASGYARHLALLVQTSQGFPQLESGYHDQAEPSYCLKSLLQKQMVGLCGKPDLLEAGMCSAYTALPDSASAAQYSPTWRRGPRPWGPPPARYVPLVVVVYCRAQIDAQSQPCWQRIAQRGA